MHGSETLTGAVREIRFMFPESTIEPIPAGQFAKDYLAKNVNPVLLKVTMRQFLESIFLFLRGLHLRDKSVNKCETFPRFFFSSFYTLVFKQCDII